MYFLILFIKSIRVNKSRRMRWVGHVARMKDVRNAYEVLVGKFIQGLKAPVFLNYTSLKY